MKELRVYINPSSTDARDEGQLMFYSRRADGPFYRWRYEEAKGQWRFARVHLSVFALRALCVANWMNVPTALQESLNQHYLE
ncbi:MAG TPA: hypothetical protein VGB17_12955 [Pyrinomonadaceae bacterium]|jgi:hypothetical protein